MLFSAKSAFSITELHNIMVVEHKIILPTDYTIIINRL